METVLDGFARVAAIMRAPLKDPGDPRAVLMRPGGTEECKRKIESFLNQGPEGLARLRELLPLIFDSHRVFTKETQMSLLRQCSLAPIQQTTPFHQVTFAIAPGMEDRAPARSTSSAKGSRRTVRTASGTSARS